MPTRPRSADFRPQIPGEAWDTTSWNPPVPNYGHILAFFLLFWPQNSKSYAVFAILVIFRTGKNDAVEVKTLNWPANPSGWRFCPIINRNVPQVHPSLRCHNNFENACENFHKNLRLTQNRIISSQTALKIRKKK